MTDAVRPMTAEDFFDLPETNHIEELIDGEYIVLTTPEALHQKCVLKIGVFLTLSAAQGETMIAPSALRIDTDYVFEPDVFWIRPNGDCSLADKRYWVGAPDLVIEVLSPSTAKRDRGVKFDVYERHGVREYWLIDPEARFVEVYQRADDRFQRLGVYGVEDTFASAALGVEVKCAAIFAE